MALDKESLKTSLVNLFTSQYAGTLSASQEAEVDNLSQGIADAIDVFVKTGTVTIASGIPVATGGTATSQTGSTTSTGTGSIS